MRANRTAGAGVASLSLGLSAYGLGGIGALICDPEVAWRSLLGGALTVNLREVLPFAGRAIDAEGRVEPGLLCLLALVYGWVASRVAVVEAVRAERRAGGILVEVL